jgi:hypothetical protein
MNERVTRLSVTGEVTHRHEADARLQGPGTAALVRRGVTRSIVIACPDGCGDTLTINLDERAGPAWRLYSDRRGISLFPSVWRDNGCRSHFIVWQSRIYWCDTRSDTLDGADAALEVRVRVLLDPTLVSYVSLADQLNEVPWAVLVACNRLVASGEAREGDGADRGKFQTP